MDTFKVLVADDDPNVRDIIRIFFQENNIELIEAEDGKRALELVEETSPDIIILDIMMPNMDGYEACREIIKKYDIPIIMLTAKGEEFDKVLGLELGADDYMTKPFSPRELMSRIKAIFRRMQKNKSEDETNLFYNFGEFTIDILRHNVEINGERVAFRPKEFDLLVHFVKSPGIIFSREKLLELVWGYDFYGDMRTVDVHVKKLREKLAPLQKHYLHTVWGVGYKFDMDVNAVDSKEDK